MAKETFTAFKAVPPTGPVRLVGRSADNSTDERAEAEMVQGVTSLFEGGAIGKSTCTLYKSLGDEDRGGYVLDLTVEDQGSAFVPYAENIPGGVRLHLTGDIEAETILSDIRFLLKE